MAVETPSVTRTMSVLHIHSYQDSGEYPVTYLADVEDEDGKPYIAKDRPMVCLSEQQAAELGSPDDITVAIWPGDRQDVMESDLEELQTEIDKLAGFIKGIKDEPIDNDDPVGTAIRLLDKAYGPPAGVDA